MQGVGFRWRTLGCAAGRDLTGFVRNLPDGTVEVVAEGAPAELEDFLAAVRGEMGALVHDERVEWDAARGDLGPFAIAP